MLVSPRKVIMVIDPAVHTPELDSFNLIAKLSDTTCTYHLPAMFGFDSFCADPESVAGVIILGSAASVYDNLPWQRPLEAFLAKMIDADVPVMGCCYGLQMIAHMYGGKIGYVYSSKEKLKGVRRINVLENPLWSSGPRQVIVTHAEMLTTMPSEFSLLATSDVVSTEGFIHKTKKVFAFQCHLEATSVFLAGHDMLNPMTANSLGDGHEILAKFVHMATGQK
jgi:GMP synthase-like glutamine amidotransferase